MRCAQLVLFYHPFDKGKRTLQVEPGLIAVWPNLGRVLPKYHLKTAAVSQLSQDAVGSSAGAAGSSTDPAHEQAPKRGWNVTRDRPPFMEPSKGMKQTQNDSLDNVSVSWLQRPPPSRTRGVQPGSRW